MIINLKPKNYQIKSKLLVSLVLALTLVGTVFADKPIFTIITSDIDSANTVKYDIQVDNNSDWSSPTLEYISSLEDPGQKTYTATLDLGPGTYYWRSKAIDIHGAESDWSATRAFTINEADDSPPNPPTNFKTVSGDEKVTLSWVNPLDSDFAEVKIFRQQGEAENNTNPIDITETQSTTATGALVENLINDIPYTFWLTALDTSGNESVTTAKLTATPGREIIIAEPPVVPPPVVEPPVIEPPVIAPIDDTTTDINTSPGPIASIFFGSINAIKNSLPTITGVLAIIGLLSSVAVPVSSALVSWILSATSAIGATSATMAGSGVLSSGVAAIHGLAGGVAGGEVGANVFVNSLGHILFGWLPKRRKKTWGKVTSKETNATIKNAFVRLISIDLDRAVDQTYSEENGRYGFPIKKPGVYKIGVFANGYTPYYSQPFNVDNIEKLPYDLDAPLEYANAGEHQKHINTALIVSKIGKLFDKIRIPILLIGTVLSIYNAVYVSNIWSIILIIIYVLLWSLEIFLNKLPQPYGNMIDSSTGKPLDRVIIRLFSLENQEQKLIYTTVTDESGKYYFLIAPGEYVINATRIGYKSFKSEKLSFKKYSNLKLNIKLDPETWHTSNDNLDVSS